MKQLLGLAVGAAGVFLAASTSLAGGLGLEAHGLYAFNFNDSASDGSNAENAFGGGASLVFNLHENIKLDLGADYYNPENKDDSDEDVQFFPICAALRVGGRLESLFLYAGGGLGYSFTWETLPLEATFENGMIYFACGGAEFSLNEHLYLRGEFRYNWLRPELKVESTGYSQDINFDHMQVRAGLGVNF